VQISLADIAQDQQQPLTGFYFRRGPGAGSPRDRLLPDGKRSARLEANAAILTRHGLASPRTGPGHLVRHFGTRKGQEIHGFSTEPGGKQTGGLRQALQCARLRGQQFGPLQHAGGPRRIVECRRYFAEYVLIRCRRTRLATDEMQLADPHAERAGLECREQLRQKALEDGHGVRLAQQALVELEQKLIQRHRVVHRRLLR